MRMMQNGTGVQPTSSTGVQSHSGNGVQPANDSQAAGQAGAQNEYEELLKVDWNAKRLTENYRNLLRMIVRYGEEPFFTDENGTIWTVGDYILGNLEADQIAAPNALYQKMVDEYKANCKTEGFKADQFFKFHGDIDVSRLGIELLSAPIN